MITAFTVLVGLAIILAVIAIIRPEYPLNSVAIVLLGAALLIGGR